MSLARSGDDTTFEVIVVDDASPRRQRRGAARHPGPALPAQSRRTWASSAAATPARRIARGEFLVFLNNDTAGPARLARRAACDLRPLSRTPAWPEASWSIRTGACRRPAASSIADGRAANYGRNGDASDPRFNFVRETDYCSGAALALPRAVFGSARRLRPAFRPGLLRGHRPGDARARARAGVRYQPASVVVHLEGVSSGTDVRQGIKAVPGREPRTNSCERWADRLDAQPPDPDRRDVDDAAAMAWPRAIPLPAPGPGDRFVHAHARPRLRLGAHGRTCSSLLVDEGCAVCFMCQNSDPRRAVHRSAAATRRGSLVAAVDRQPAALAGARRTPVRRGDRFASLRAVADAALAAPSSRRNAQVVFDTVDLHFLREQREAEQAPSAAARASANRTREAELGAGQEQRRNLGGQRGRTRNCCVRCRRTPRCPSSPTSMTSRPRRPGSTSAATCCSSAASAIRRTSTRRVAGLGNLPAHARAMPDLKLHLVGADAPDSVRALAQQPGVVVHGHVPDLEALLDRTRISRGAAALRRGNQGQDQPEPGARPARGRHSVRGRRHVPGRWKDVLLAERCTSLRRRRAAPVRRSRTVGTAARRRAREHPTVFFPRDCAAGIAGLAASLAGATR